MAKKIIGNCKVEGCEKELDSLGFCGYHYRMNRLYGRTHKVRGMGKRGHRQYYNWASRKDSDICDSWKDFWNFVKDVGDEPPSKYHYLRKVNKNRPLGPDNYMWQEHLHKHEDETIQEWRARKWAARVKIEPSLNRNLRTFVKFGIPLAEYTKIIEERIKEYGNLCGICKKPETKFHKKNNTPFRLALDHCHETNKIRGLLCSRCNTTLGRMEDSIELLQSMILYLQKYS